MILVLPEQDRVKLHFARLCLRRTILLLNREQEIMRYAQFARLRGMGYPRFGLLASACLAMLVAASPTPAATVSDNFNDGNDTGWTRYDTFAGFGAPGSWTFPSGGYRIESPASPAPTTLGPSRGGSLYNGFTASNFRVSIDLIDWVTTHDQAAGPIARITNPGLGTTNGYAFVYSTGNGTTNDITITRITAEATTNLANTQVILDPDAGDYRMVFEGFGSLLTGTVYDVTDLTTPLATVSVVDTAHASGVTGTVVFDNTNRNINSIGTDFTFDNFEATDVPEPATVGLALAVGLIALRRRPVR